MRSYLAKHPGEPFTGVMLDIDNFKSVNDLHGHEAGDAALKVLAEALKSFVDDRGIAVRYGGDEFCIILKNMTAEQAAPSIENFGRNTFAYPAGGAEDTFTISIGYASCPEDAKDWRQIYLLADAALYAGKFMGKHACMRYDASVLKFIRKSQDIRIPEMARKMPLPFLVCEDEGDRTILFASLAVFRLLDYDDLDALEHSGRDRLRYILDEESFDRLARKELQDGDLVYAVQRDGGKTAVRIWLGYEKTAERKTPIVMLVLIPEKPEELTGREKEEAQ